MTLIAVEKISAFHQPDLVIYLQSLLRASSSSNIYSYNQQFVEEFVDSINNIQEDDELYTSKLINAYRLLFYEITMCDNYVKVLLDQEHQYGSYSLYQMVDSLTSNINLMFEPYHTYRENLLTIAGKLIQYKDIVDIYALYKLNEEVYNLYRPIFHIFDIENDVQVVYTPFDITIDDIAYIQFDTPDDYKTALTQCKNTQRCALSMSKDITHLKDLYNTVYSTSLRILYDNISNNNQSRTLMTHLSRILIQDIMLRDCQSSQPYVLSHADNSSFDTHLMFRKVRWNSAMMLYDLSSADYNVINSNISTLFNQVISNYNMLHINLNLQKSLSTKSIDEIVTILSKI